MPFAHLQAFLDETRGQITIGEIPPIRSAALAAVGKRVRVALLRRDDENLAQLLERLDAALVKVMADDSVVDEVLPEIKRRRSR
ncbi:MAG: hypothetical protein WBV35_08500 [Steroidobacteraceae bacterium]